MGPLPPGTGGAGAAAARVAVFLVLFLATTFVVDALTEERVERHLFEDLRAQSREWLEALTLYQICRTPFYAISGEPAQLGGYARGAALHIDVPTRATDDLVEAACSHATGHLQRSNGTAVIVAQERYSPRDVATQTPGFWYYVRRSGSQAHFGHLDALKTWAMERDAEPPATGGNPRGQTTSDAILRKCGRQGVRRAWCSVVDRCLFLFLMAEETWLSLGCERLCREACESLASDNVNDDLEFIYVWTAVTPETEHSSVGLWWCETQA